MKHGKHPDCSKVKDALKRMGFKDYQTKGSHNNWKKHSKDKKRLWKVTVDCPKSPFSHDLVASMANQAGVSKRLFLEYCFNKKKKDDPHS